MANGNETNSVATIANMNFRSLSELLAQLDNNTARGIVKSITYDTQSQKVVLQLADFLKNEAEIQKNERVVGNVTPDVVRALQRLRNISSKYAGTYPDLKKYFNEWRVIRKELVEKSESGADSLDSNFKLASICRLIGSSVNLVGTIGENFFNHLGPNWAKYAFLTCSSFGFLSLVATVAEVAVSKGIHDDMNDYIKSDQKKFSLIKKWLKQTEELDAAVKEFFPHGIDKDIVRKIEEASKHQEDDLKIFNAALVTNVEKEPELIQNMEFLKKVSEFSTDKVAQEWWKRVLIMQDPIHIVSAKLFLENMQLQSETILSQSFPALPLDMMRLSTLRYQAKVVLDGLTIFNSIRSLRKRAASKYSDSLRDLKSETESELEAMEAVVRNLKPG